MNNITVVTGPLRSGTSCVTGALERCGFDLGRNVRVLRKETPFNPRGHFEPDLLFTINERLMTETLREPWTPALLPESEPLAELAERRNRYFRLFIRKFDGELFKDPLLCLTLPLWERHWPALRKAVFCLRHPLAAARSMEKRYLLSIARGLQVWEAYTARFFDGGVRSEAFIFDFDAFIEKPIDVFSRLLSWLGRPADTEHVEKGLSGFFDPEHVAWRFGEAELREVPREVGDLYLDLRSRAAAPVPEEAHHD